MPVAPGRILFLLAVVTLPWVGVGLIHALTGKDVGGGLQPSWLFLAVALPFLSARLLELMRQGRGRLLIWLTALPLLAFILSLLGLRWAPSGESFSVSGARWLRQVIQWLIMMAFAWGAVLHLQQEKSWRATLDALFAGVLLQVLYSAWQTVDFWHPGTLYQAAETFFTSNPSILASSERLYVNNVLQDFPRLRGTVCEPLYLGNYLVAVWPFLLVWRRPAAWRLVLGMAMGIILAMTFSRGAWLGFLAQAGLLAAWWLLGRGRRRDLPNRRTGLLVVAVAMGVLIAGDSLSGGFFRQRLAASFNNQDWSNLTRLYSMQAAWRAFLLSPWVGVGWGQYAFHFPLLVDPMGLQSQFTWPVVNNFPLQILCETGLVGFSCTAGAVVLLGRKARQTLAGGGWSDRPRVGLAALALVGVTVQMLTFSQYNLPHIWLVLGLLIAALSGPPEGRKESP